MKQLHGSINTTLTLVQFSSVTQSCPTLRPPWTAARQASLSNPPSSPVRQPRRHFQMTRLSKRHAPATFPHVLLFRVTVTLGADKLVDVADGLCCSPQLNRPREQQQRRTTL